MTRKLTRRTAGFTLVEIMIVLAILVLLMSMVAPRLLGSKDKADKKITASQINSVRQSLDFYRIDNRSYPSTEEGLQALVQRPADETRGFNWDGPYMEELPVDPWGNAYRYEFPPTRGGPQDVPNIWSTGPDGADQSDDDIVSWSGGPTDGNPSGAQSTTNSGNNPTTSAPSTP